MRWALEQLGKLDEMQPDLVDDALQTLWQQSPALLRRLVIGAYLDEQISLSRAAELVGLTRLELQRQLVQEGIPIRSLSEEACRAEVEALRQRSQAV
jgi:predicted HTH domain antitoxin